MNVIVLILLLSTGFFLSSAASLAQSAEGRAQAITNAAVMLKDVPPFEGESFCCGSVVHTVNYLRRLGKDDAIKALRLYLQDYGSHPDLGQNENIFLICRLLFIDPEGWKQPRFGEPAPEVNGQLSDKFPIFPLTLSRGVPFVLILGYNSTGYTDETSEKCVKLCEGFNLISHDLPEDGYEDAARALVESEDLKTLYLNTNGLMYVDKMILEEARCPVVRRGANFKSSIDVKSEDDPSTNK